MHDSVKKKNLPKPDKKSDIWLPHAYLVSSSAVSMFLPRSATVRCRINVGKKDTVSSRLKCLL